MHPNATKKTEAPAPPKPHTPWFTNAVFVACVGMFAVEVAMRLFAGDSRWAQSLALGHRPPFPLYGPAVAQGEWWLIPLSALEHGGLIHLLFNMSAIPLGRIYEGAIGTLRFTLLSVAGLLGCALFQLALGFDRPAVGASGMLVGWFGAMFPIGTRHHRWDLGASLVATALLSFFPRVSWEGHLGGFLAGLLCGLLLAMGPTWAKKGIPVVIAALIAGLFAVVSRAEVEQRVPVQVLRR